MNYGHKDKLVSSAKTSTDCLYPPLYFLFSKYKNNFKKLSILAVSKETVGRLGCLILSYKDITHHE